MRLKKTRPPRSMISLVSMIDVLMIMLVFFMVTSTYLNLDMIPMVKSGDNPQSPVSTTNSEPAASTVLVRLGSEGGAYYRGQPMGLAVLEGLIKGKLESNPATSVMVLPSANARTQDLVSLMDSLTRAGVSRLKIIQMADPS